LPHEIGYEPPVEIIEHYVTRRFDRQQPVQFLSKKPTTITETLSKRYTCNNFFGDVILNLIHREKEHVIEYQTYKTIAETERIMEFTEVKNINELWEYLSHEKVEGLSNMGVLDTIGYDGTEQPAKIIYDYGNGEEKILEENDVMGILELFRNNSLRDGQFGS